MGPLNHIIQVRQIYYDPALSSLPSPVKGDARAGIALNILSYLMSLYYAAIIKTICPPGLLRLG